MIDNKKLLKLHEKLVNEVIYFCIKENLTDVNEFNLFADGLEDSIKFGSWHPSTDSAFIMKDINNNTIGESI